MKKIPKSIYFLIPSLAAVILLVNFSTGSAQTPEVYFQELDIIPDSPQRPNSYIYIFNVCVDGDPNDGIEEVFDPKIIIKSDLETRTLQIATVFSTNECVGAVEKIRATNPDSIQAEVVSYGNYDQVEDMKNRIDDLERQAHEQQEELKEVMNRNYQHHQDYIDATKEVSDKLWSTRKQLQSLTEQYYQMMNYLHPEIEN